MRPAVLSSAQGMMSSQAPATQGSRYAALFASRQYM